MTLDDDDSMVRVTVLDPALMAAVCAAIDEGFRRSRPVLLPTSEAGRCVNAPLCGLGPNHKGQCTPATDSR